MFNMSKNFVPFMGVVENNVDERLEGRVQVRAFGFHGTADQIPTADLPWAIPVLGSYDFNTPPPPLNAWVFGFFMDGQDAQQPIIIGIIPSVNTNVINQTQNGWGSPMRPNYELLSYGSRAADYGQPNSSKLARGENIDQTYVIAQEVTRVKSIKGADGNEWEEPGSAYNAQYPFNRVIETAGGHSIELDDTPGAERMMFYHKSGSYIQIDSAGTTTNKSTSDKFDINETNLHIYVGGKCVVNVMGDSYVHVAGNKIEEIGGDFRQVVHGNYELSVAGQMNLNASDEVQMRAAKLTLESNVEDTSIKGAKAVKVESGTGVHIKAAEGVFAQAGEGFDVKADNVKIQGASVNIKGEDVNIGGGGQVSVTASVVFIDDVVKLAEGGSTDPESAGEAESAKSTTMLEPASKSVSLSAGSSGGLSSRGSDSVGTNGAYNSPSSGSSGYAASDNLPEYTDLSGQTSSCSSDLIAELKEFESFSAKAYSDSKQISIGYGTMASSINEVIDEPEAERRLKARVASDRASIIAYGNSHGYEWNDCQVDALTSFKYNIGSIFELTANGTRSNEVIAQKMLEYINADGKPNVGLIKRRKRESDWFINGTLTSGKGSSIPVEQEGTLI